MMTDEQIEMIVKNFRNALKTKRFACLFIACSETEEGDPTVPVQFESLGPPEVVIALLYSSLQRRAAALHALMERPDAPH